MRTNKFSLAGILAGIVWSIGSFIRYYVLYPDVDKVIAYVLLGGVVCGLAWLYDKYLKIISELNEIQDRIVDLDFDNMLKGGGK